MSLELMSPRELRPPQVRQFRERKPVQNTLTLLTGSQREMARRHLSGKLIEALRWVEKFWRPGYSDLSQRAVTGHVTTARLFGPGRAPPDEEPDFYTLRYRTQGAILGAEGGLFDLPSQMIVMPDENFFLAVARLRSEGLCCSLCVDDSVGIYHSYQSYLKNETGDLLEDARGRWIPERCVLRELLTPSPEPELWETHAEAVVKIPGMPDEYIRVALILIDQARFYDATPRPIRHITRGRPSS